MKAGANSIPSDGILFKREQSPIESMPRSRMGSAEAISQHGLDDFDRASPDAEQANSEIVNDENALEALLSSSINHDTSDEAIASQIAR